MFWWVAMEPKVAVAALELTASLILQ